MSMSQSSHFPPKTPYRKNNINYQQIIEKQLIDDFQVYQYLNENKLQGNNVEEYSRLYNSLLVQKDSKYKSLEYLNCYHEKLKLVNKDEVNVSTISQFGNILKEGFIEQQYKGTQSVLCNEIQVKKNLWKEIIESKKSLSLLKGDIGHLVSRNESAKLLQSKISKVKIVADDQLKRVSLAFGKDKEELKIRNQMQKNFNYKLKNVSMFQDISLNRMKKSYIQLMTRRKDINDRLAHIQKVSSSIHEYGDMNKQKNVKNYQTNQLYIRLLNLARLLQSNKEDSGQNRAIELSEKLEYLKEQFQKISHNTFQFLADEEYTSQVLQVMTQNSLKEIQSTIIKQFNHLQAQIYDNCCLYNQSISQIQQSLHKYQKLEENIQQINNRYSEEGAERFYLTGCEKALYYLKLKQFRNNLTILFKIIIFFHKNNQNTISQNYVSQLHQIYMFLLKDQEDQENQLKINLSNIDIYGENIHHNFQNNLSQWFHQYLKSKTHQRSSSTLNSNAFPKEIYNLKGPIHQIREDTEEQDKQKILEAESNMFGIDNNSVLNMINLPNSCVNSVGKARQAHSIKKKNSQSSYTKNHYPEVKAQRIQYLENVDQDYYKMLKNTLKMQKQNTRKNYEFMRSFKRTKYANRDEILAQKRFQSKFSVLLTNIEVSKQKKNIRKHREFNVNTQKLMKTNQKLLSQSIIKKKSVDFLRHKQNKEQQFKLNKKLKEVLDITEMI